MSNTLEARRNSRLFLWRTEAGFTLEEVAGLVGLSAAMLRRVERGERQFSSRTKVVVARRLGVPVGELFEVEELPE
jgi:transcriptional regulator with XRE-family HTH domain